MSIWLLKDGENTSKNGFSSRLNCLCCPLSKFIHLQGSVNVVTNYVSQVYNEMLLNMVAEKFSMYSDEKVNAEMNYK